MADPDRLRVCAKCRPRALRIVQALVTAAEEHGHQAGPVDADADADEGGALVVVVKGHRYPVAIWESSDRVPRAAQQRYGWQRITEREDVPAGRLELTLPEGYPHAGRRSRWGDRQRWRLEAKLGQVLAEIEQRGERDEAARRAAEQQALERRQRWEQAMVAARQRVIDERRLTALRDQLDAWQQARTIRAYAGELEQQLAAAGERSAADADAARAWVVWLRAYADRIDPCRQLPGLPPEGEIGPQDLRPYLGGSARTGRTRPGSSPPAAGAKFTRSLRVDARRRP